MPMIGARFYAQIDSLHVRGDILENELAKVSKLSERIKPTLFDYC
jgi:hypothetical protein